MSAKQKPKDNHKGKPKPKPVRAHNCPFCGSTDTAPMRGAKGGHWWACFSCLTEW